MVPQLEKIPLHFPSSIAVKREISPYMDYPWHYHPEYEIIYVQKSYGIRLVGDSIANFADGDLMFISPNLPHVWKNDKNFYQGNKKLFVDVYVIHFLESVFHDILNLPEFGHIKTLFSLGQQGLLIKENDRKRIIMLIKKVHASSGIERLTYFFKTLDAFAQSKNYELLSSPAYTPSTNITTERIDKVINFLLENYNREIQLEEVANLINLSKASFCRYFKSRTHKTCSHFLNEIRIGHACKLLINSDMTTSEICYEIGYNNISHFNRMFKRITRMTSTAYKSKYQKNIHNAPEVNLKKSVTSNLSVI